MNREKLKEKMKYLNATAVVWLINFNTGYANDLQTSIFATGTEKLLKDASNVLVGISAVGTVVAVIIFAIMRGQADEVDQKAWGKRIKNAYISGGLGLTAGVLLKLIMSYYGVTIDV